MDADEFRIRGKEVVDFIADYLENVKDRRVTPDVEPGYLRAQLPHDPPVKGEKWETIFKDFEDKILTGVTHWQHPRFHAYFPAGNCYPSIIGEMLSAGLGIVGFSWAASPACTELETIVLQWLGKMIGLPEVFLPFRDTEEENENDHICNMGGGVILGSASECVLVALLSARTETLSRMREENPATEDGHNLSKLVMYTSKLGHSCIEKAAMIAMVKIRLLDTDEDYALRGETLEKAIQEDRKKGLVPFFAACTFGTTAVCSFDCLEEIGLVCNRESVHLHVDGAYAGSALICPEFREFAHGLQLVDSFNFNPNKWMLVNFDCSCLWVKDKYKLTKALSVDPVYLRYREMDKAIDYRHWGIALSRRFRALKIWFTLRSYGVEGLQKYIREHVRLAKVFEQCILSDPRFEIVGHVTMGLVCFRLKGPNSLSQSLLYLLNDSGRIHMIPSMIDGKYAIRFCVNYKNACEDDIRSAWDLIRNALRKNSCENANISASKLKRLRYGISKMISDPRTYNHLNDGNNNCNELNNNELQTNNGGTKASASLKPPFKFASLDYGHYLTHRCTIINATFDEEEC